MANEGQLGLILRHDARVPHPIPISAMLDGTKRIAAGTAEFHADTGRHVEQAGGVLRRKYLRGTFPTAG